MPLICECDGLVFYVHADTGEMTNLFFKEAICGFARRKQITPSSTTTDT